MKRITSAFGAVLLGLLLLLLLLIRETITLLVFAVVAVVVVLIYVFGSIIEACRNRRELLKNPLSWIFAVIKGLVISLALALGVCHGDYGGD